MMARKRSKGLNDNHIKVLEVIDSYMNTTGYPPSIREICDEAKISSTSVANYYLDHLENEGYIERHRKVSRGLKIIKPLSDIAEYAQETSAKIQNVVSELLQIPIYGTIVASAPVTSFTDQPKDMIEVARSLLPKYKEDELFALEVRGDSMIDAMVNDGDIVIMQPPKNPVRNGDMVAVWLNDRDETTLKYFFNEGNRVKLQPANPLLDPIYIEDPNTVEIHGQVVMVLRQMDAPQ